ncbi:hypothetical protein [Cohnella sp. 56]|uniref:hypothetical protein n=1 Tax=Cohnella sp. 56 TaxID=3113722 RepID=UPI0030E90447
MNIGRRVYFDKLTGDIVQDTGDRSGSVVETTVEQDFEVFQALKERDPETVGMLQLEYGEFAEDFMAANGYRVDVSSEHPSLLFSYPDPAQPEELPVYRPPLSRQVAEQERRLADVELVLADLLTGGDV